MTPETAKTVQLGDTVTLKTGGPSMIVSLITTKPDLERFGEKIIEGFYCVWFDTLKRMQREFCSTVILSNTVGSEDEIW